MHEKIDSWLGKWASRKLIVWGTSTAFLAAGSLTSSDWVAVSLAYIGLTGCSRYRCQVETRLMKWLWYKLKLGWWKFVLGLSFWQACLFIFTAY